MVWENASWVIKCWDWETDKNSLQVQKSAFRKINSWAVPCQSKCGSSYLSGWRNRSTGAWRGKSDFALWAECESPGQEGFLYRLRWTNIHFSTTLSLWSTATGRRKRERDWKQRRKIKIHSWQRLSVYFDLGWAAHCMPTISKMPWEVRLCLSFQAGKFLFFFLLPWSVISR